MSRLHVLLREPLVQFLAVGALLLAAQNWLAAKPDSQIEVTTEQIKAVTESFRSAHGRNPDDTETAALIQRWIDDEVLYRQALALGLDRADLIVRRELTQKMRFLIEDTTPVADPTEEELQQWLAAHPQRYGQPGAVDFQQVFLSRSANDQRKQAVAASLKQQPQRYADLGDTLPGGADWRAQSEADLRRNFGNAFAASVAKLPDGQWNGPLPSSLGTHWVRVTARSAFKPATLDQVRHQVLVDCRVAKREATNRTALDKLRRHYDILMPGAAS